MLNSNLWLVLGAGGAAGGWMYYRSAQRQELLRMLEESPAVFTARVYAQQAQLGPAHAWLKEPGGLVEKANELVTYTNTTSAVDAFNQLVASLPKAPPQVGVLPGLLDDGLQALSQATGINIPRGVQQEVHGLAQTEQGQQAEGLLTHADGLWSWWLGTEENRARPNPDPHMTWDRFLVDVY